MLALCNLILLLHQLVSHLLNVALQMLRPLERTQRAFVALAAGSKREALLPGGDFGLRKPVPNTRMIDVAFENYFVQVQKHRKNFCYSSTLPSR